ARERRRVRARGAAVCRGRAQRRRNQGHERSGESSRVRAGGPRRRYGSTIRTDTNPNVQSAPPDARGYFGRFGGVFVPEVLVEALARLEAATQEAFADPAFWSEYESLLRDYVGRP